MVELRIRQGDSRRQRTPPRYAEAGTGTYEIFTVHTISYVYHIPVGCERCAT
jgi:hypothetical protein